MQARRLRRRGPAPKPPDQTSKPPSSRGGDEMRADDGKLDGRGGKDESWTDGGEDSRRTVGGKDGKWADGSGLEGRDSEDGGLEGPRGEDGRRADGGGFDEGRATRRRGRQPMKSYYGQQFNKGY